MERSLRVLDGAVLVLCAVAGVQSQSITVDRQMRRYKVPRIAFINKCDRTGANPDRVVRALRDKLGHHPVLLQIPIGLEADFEGVVDLIEMQAVYFRGPNGEQIEIGEIPEALRAQAEERRAELIDTASMFSDELLEAALEDQATPELIREAVRRGTLSLELTPVLVGLRLQEQGRAAAARRRRRLPAEPRPRSRSRPSTSTTTTRRCSSQPTRPAQTVAYAFKLDEGRFGQLTYMRVYQGTLAKGDIVIQTRTGRQASASAAWCGCTPTTWRTSPRRWPATSSACSASTATPATPSSARAAASP